MVTLVGNRDGKHSEATDISHNEHMWVSNYGILVDMFGLICQMPQQNPFSVIRCAD